MAARPTSSYCSRNGAWPYRPGAGRPPRSRLTGPGTRRNGAWPYRPGAGLVEKQPSDLRKRRSTRALRFQGQMIWLFDLVRVPKTASDLHASTHAHDTLHLSTRSVGPCSHRQSDSTGPGRNGRHLSQPGFNRNWQRCVAGRGNDLVPRGWLGLPGGPLAFFAAMEPCSWWPGVEVPARYADPTAPPVFSDPRTRKAGTPGLSP